MKKHILLPVFFLGSLLATEALAQKKAAPAAIEKTPKTMQASPVQETKKPVAESVQAAAEIQPDLAGLIDQTPKDDTPLESVVRGADAVVETTDKGLINWSDQYVEATGISIIDNARFTNKAQANAMATRGAVVDAQRNLLEIVKGVEVTGETTIENFMTTSDKVTTKVQGVIKGAYQVGKPRFTADGAVEVTMRVPLYAKNGVASAVISEVPNVVQQQARIMQKEAGIDASEAITPAAPKAVTSTSTSAFTAENGKPIVFTMGGKTVDPSMFPVIFDQKGNVALDMSKIYDPSKGSFPKILQASKDIMKDAGFAKGVEIVDLIQDKATGQLKISDLNKAKINWGKIGKTAGKIASFLLMLV